MKLWRRPGRSLALVAAILVLLAVTALDTASGSASGGGDPASGQTLTELGRRLESQLALLDGEERLAACFGTTGEGFNLVATRLAAAFGDKKIQRYLEGALDGYRQNISSGLSGSASRLAGINLLYQSVDGLAYLLASRSPDKGELQNIRDTEQRTIEVVRRADNEPGPALAALSGGIMSLLSSIARQIDGDGTMKEALTGELERRRSVDQNISGLEGTAPGTRLLLMFNNHLQGSISMAQVIGLSLAPDTRGRLAAIEKKLAESKDAGLEAQILAAAEALARTGFIILPPLAQAGHLPN